MMMLARVQPVPSHTESSVWVIFNDKPKQVHRNAINFDNREFVYFCELIIKMSLIYCNCDVQVLV